MLVSLFSCLFVLNESMNQISIEARYLFPVMVNNIDSLEKLKFPNEELILNSSEYLQLLVTRDSSAPQEILFCDSVCYLTCTD